MLDKLKYEHISIMAAVMWEILSIIIFALIYIVVFIVLAPYTWLWYTIVFVLGLLFIGVSFIYVPFLYLNTKFALTDEIIVYKKGVLFPSVQILYKSRIAFVTVYNNPLTSLLHVSTLVISAAGATMTILFMNSDKAEEVARKLSDYKAEYCDEN
ncbi:MAG: PH domain-containing protein [Oscillospiraceae bacterium]